MRKAVIIPLLLCLFLLPQTAKSESVNLTLYLPPDNHSVLYNTSIILNATLVSDVNGSMYMYWDIYKLYCGYYTVYVTPPSLICDLSINPENVSLGTHYWWASFNTTTNNTYTTSKRRLYATSTDFNIIPISPINNQTVIGDYTNFSVNLSVDVYVPYDLTSEKFIYFYGYNSYEDLPVYSSEWLLGVVEVPEGTQEGIHRFYLRNYMYGYPTPSGYDESPSYKFWRAKLRATRSEIDGANLLGDTGLQDYTYVILTTLANAYPINMTVLGDELFLRLREMQGGTPAWYLLHDPFNFINVRTDDTFTFYAYTRNPCVGNLTFRLQNILNASYTVFTSYNDTPVETIGYYLPVIWNPDENQTGMRIDNETVLVNHTYYWTFYCNNGTSYSTDIYFIYNYAYQPVAPTAPNITAPYYTFVNATGEYFNVETSVALMFMGGIWTVAIVFFVSKKGGKIAGGIAGIIALLVFTKLGWFPIWISIIMLICAGFVVVILIRRTFLGD